MPSLEVRSRRVGGATYQVPVEVRVGAPAGAGHPLADRGRARPQRAHHGGASFRANCSTRPTIAATR